MTHDEFRDRLDKLNEVLLDALTHYAVWLGLWPSQENVDMLNQFSGFFFPVRRALLSITLLQCAKLFDTDPRTISLTNLLKEAKRAPDELVPYAESGALERMSRQIAEVKRVRRNLTRMRNQEIAHLDANPKGGKTPLLGEMDDFIEMIQSVFNGLALANDRRGFHWSHLQSSGVTDTMDVLRILKESAEQEGVALQQEIDRLSRSEGAAT